MLSCSGDMAEKKSKIGRSFREISSENKFSKVMKLNKRRVMDSLKRE